MLISSIYDNGAALRSQWLGLSDALIAKFYEVAKEKKSGDWVRIPGENGTDPATVFAPLTECTMDISLNWQSPFESSGPESKAPMLAAMFQSGALQPLVHAINDTINIVGSKLGIQTDSAQVKSDNFVKQFEGRTGITKLNSTQVFSGMPPIKIQVVALFRAWSDPVSEVEAPINCLMKWALPVKLAPDGSFVAKAIEGTIGGTISEEGGYLNALMPSKSPTRIAMEYKGRIYSPLVIEAVTLPLGSPVSSSAKYVEMLVPMTLCTLTAMDRDDWKKIPLL